MRVRCIGAAGTGHSAWSEGVLLDIPGPRQAGQVGSQGTELATVSGLPRNRRSGRDLRQLDADSTDTQTPALKTQRTKRADSLSLGRLRSESRGHTIACA